MAKNEAMAALVSTKSARERLEKSTGDFDGTDDSADDDGAAEVAEGHALMMGEGRSRAFALGSCYDGGKGRWRLVARHGWFYRSRLHSVHDRERPRLT
jgi:hypothetical protein